ncbi:MAG: glycosyltransferase [Pseudomonadota bacterium]
MEYADLLSSYAITLNFTARANGVGILTARTLEALLYGSLLLEQQSGDATYFLRPFEHYVPFTTFAELAARLRRVIDDAPLRQTHHPGRVPLGLGGISAACPSGRICSRGSTSPDSPKARISG